MTSGQRQGHELTEPHVVYPYGLTPFRFPCLHPDDPPPPPGDPADPKFKRYEPLDQLRPPATSATLHAVEGSNSGPSRTAADRSTGSASAGPDPHGTAPPKTDEEMATDAYESLQALLAASEDPNLTSIGGVDFDSFAMLGEPGSSSS